ncbi:MAG TPA: lysine 2,3-aminomutase, partial [Candidatus Syntrophosphaera sp.]|nr:lysine 2,3-aminomutase [Candidatus Syntrophosphaera sp.]
MAKLTNIRSIATDKEWNDWHWQLRTRITDLRTLAKYIKLQPEEEAVAKSQGFSFRMAITPYYL